MGRNLIRQANIMLAEKPWKLEAVLRLFLCVMITVFIGGLVAGLVNHFTSTWPKGQSDFWQIVFPRSSWKFPPWVGSHCFCGNIK